MGMTNVVKTYVHPLTIIAITGDKGVILIYLFLLVMSKIMDPL